MVDGSKAADKRHAIRSMMSMYVCRSADISRRRHWRSDATRHCHNRRWFTAPPAP